MKLFRQGAALIAAAMTLAACGGAATVTVTSDPNPTVPPVTPSPRAALTLDDLPALPDALTITPGDRFTVLTTPSMPAQVEAYYTAQLAGLGLALAARQEDAAGLFGRGLLLTYAGGDARVYVMAMPDFENGATGVLLTLDGALLRQE